MSPLSAIDQSILPYSWRWFEKNGLWLSQLGLPEDIKVRICSKTFSIGIISSPGSKLSSDVPVQVNNLIILDATLLDEEILGRREMIATLLHEIGHIVNEPDSTINYLNDSAINEAWADDFARSSGYENELISSWAKLKRLFPKAFSEQNMSVRIARIVQRAEPNLRNI